MQLIYCGPQGSFSEEATRAVADIVIERSSPKSLLQEPLEEPLELVMVANFREVFSALTAPNANASVPRFGVVPIENSIAGSVLEVFDLLDKENVYVVGEIYLRIRHNLCGRSSSLTDVEAIAALTTVYSHPMALAQVTQFLQAHPHITSQPTLSTSAAAELVAAQGSPTIAAICSRRAAELVNLRVIRPDIEDDPRNFTRFFLISGDTSPLRQVGSKCSLIMILNHSPGTLVNVLSVLANDNANLTKIESRPLVGQTFSYRFHLDFELGDSGSKITQQLVKYTQELRILGIYNRLGGDIITHPS